MATFKFYTDSGLTTEHTGNLVASHDVDQLSGDVDQVLYFGSVAASKTLQAVSNPGVDQITLSLADSNVSPGNGPETTDYKLALTALGLDSAVAGDPLDIGTTLNSGVGNAVQVHIRRSPPDTTGVTGVFTECSFATNSVQEI